MVVVGRNDADNVNLTAIPCGFRDVLQKKCEISPEVEHDMVYFKLIQKLVESWLLSPDILI